MIKTILLAVLVVFSGCSATEKKMPDRLTEGTPVFRSDDPVRFCKDGSVDMGNLGRVVYVSTPLPLPLKPAIPKIKGKDLSCLSPTTQWELKNRDTILKDYISELETIIKSTQK